MASPAELCVELVLGGTVYKLVYGTLAVAVLEETFGTADPRALAEGGRLTSALLALFWAELQRYHPLTREAAADLIDTYGAETIGTAVWHAYFKHAGLDLPASEEGGGAPFASAPAGAGAAS
jgi:hypothetical protein